MPRMAIALGDPGPGSRHSKPPSWHHVLLGHFPSNWTRCSHYRSGSVYGQVTPPNSTISASVTASPTSIMSSSKRTGMFKVKTPWSSGDSPVPESSGPQSFVFSLDHRPRATRASVPKVRSGCVTWRRHVKCDEAKPACQRCLKWQGFCDGYRAAELAPPKDDKRRRRSSPSARSETSDSGLPDNFESLQLGDQFGVGENSSQESSQNSEFDDQWETFYCDCWSSLANNLGGGWFSSRLFTQTIPQISQDEPAIRYAILAIGALACSLSPNIVPAGPSVGDANDYHYNAALTHYGQAIRLIRLQQEPNSASTLRVAVVACILFACFEVLHGSHEAAVNHISFGSLMLVGQAAAGQIKLEDEIMQVFERMEWSAWSIGLMTGTAQVLIGVNSRFSPDDMPTKFSGLGEARRCWDAIQHWTLHFSQAMGGPTYADGDFLPEIRIMQSQCVGMLERWNSLFWPLYNSANSSRKGPSYYQAASLLLQSIVLHAYINTCGFQDNYAIEQITPQFKEMVRLSGALLGNQPVSKGCSEVFTLDSGPTCALFVAATKCLDPAIQAEATLLLRSYPRRDGFWDSRAALGILDQECSLGGEYSGAVDPAL
ncbi:hypothetical protein QBC36DRAFT_327786 [Triangularia setosa]|uniref:Zn(2)-C6 fungal-type domain-containing protein n=1 Tax=Triangularia setosa TaxID=2587417 RepID=A0AAN6W8E3_9PEZI|nr:hypothetical protein QBC36DRAFT_327786 [Podospora setosa]